MLNDRLEKLSFLALLALVTLSGCQQTKSQTGTNASIPIPPPSISVPAVATNTAAPTNTPPTAPQQKMGLCQSQLASLRSISPKTYGVRKAQFDGLVNSASVYTAVRGEVSGQTKETVDALYKYKTNQICADIERDVMQGLIRRGESVK